MGTSEMIVVEKERKTGRFALGILFILGGIVFAGVGGTSGPQPAMVGGGIIGFLLGVAFVASGRKRDVVKKGSVGVYHPKKVDEKKSSS